ncbi:hypothetical protein [Paenibacillus donghaensis]|uniref:Group-specific protein n=1 Tax=Paenibacillus donghaensis TaxID=414771 RepID=A0A2Z2K578_9BACL|nr:hypothetical protein [Paenibacillus donghaensis]ASA19634.1 hypothetical protein B9T62_01645 [Paenibacillus donghaensis]
MFHPTVFDNIKISFENQLYDYDNLDGILVITDRSDLLNLALMSREFSLSFKLLSGRNITTEVFLSSSVKDLSDEILEAPDTDPGCNLSLRFYMEIEDIDVQCPAVERVLSSIWGPELKPVQALSFMYGQDNDTYNNCVELKFNRQITEEQMEDIPSLLNHLLQSAEELENI